MRWAKHRFQVGRSATPVEAQHPVYRIPEGERVYAIGDVHGRFDLLFRLLSTIRGQEKARPPARTTIVMIGDLIDRGPESAAVVQFVSSWTQPWAKMVVLKGNHEAKLISLLEGQSVRLSDWLKMGGAETLQSYGLSDDMLRTAQTGVLIEAARSAIPVPHQQ